MALYDKASLVLIPSGTKEGVVFSQKPTNGDGDFTFTRASSATRVNSDGLIEKETQNLLKYSGDLTQSQWENIRTTDVSGQAGYDGTNNAFKIIPTTDNNTHRLDYVDTWSTGQVYTFSFYAKASGYNTIDIVIGGTSIGSLYGRFNLSTGTATNSNSISASMEDLGGGWYRCQVAQISGSTTRINIGVNDGTTQTYAGDGTSGVLIQHPQLNQGLVADSYLETTTTAVYGGITDNIPRLDYTDASCPSLLLEGQRTNSLLYSEDFSNAVWSKTNSIITINSAESPEGVDNAAAFIENTSYGEHRIQDGVGLTNGINYTFSVFVKANGRNFIRLRLENSSIGSGQINTWFNISDGTVGTSSAGTNSIVDMGNGWYRCISTGITNTTSYLAKINVCDADNNVSYTGDGSSGVYIYGAQLEEASYATSYIPTYGASVTFASDNPNMQISSLVPNGFFSDTYSIMFDYKDFDRGAASANLNYLYDTSNQVCMYIYAGTIAIHTPSGEQYIPFPQADGKIAFIYDGTNLKIYKNGSQYNSTIAVSTRWENPNFYRLYALNTTSTISYNTFMLFPTALTDEEAIALTTI